MLAPDGGCFALQMERSSKMCDGGRADQTLVGLNYSASYRLWPPPLARRSLLGFLSTRPSLSRSGSAGTHTDTLVPCDALASCPPCAMTVPNEVSADGASESFSASLNVLSNVDTHLETLSHASSHGEVCATTHPFGMSANKRFFEQASSPSEDYLSTGFVLSLI